MGKILKLLILFLLCFSFVFGATNYENQLAQFDTSYKRASKDGMLKYHHMLKNIYIQSIIKNDLRLKIRALKRLIITSSSLGLDSKSYKKELVTLQKMAGKKGSGIKKLKLTKLPKTTDYSSLYSSSKKSKPKKKPLIDSSARMMKIQSSSKGISLLFDRDIDGIDIKTFVLKGKKNYRYVYDISGILMGKAKTFKIKNIEKIQVVQYNKKTIRVVFTDPKKIKLFYSKIDNSINIGSKHLRAKSTKIAPKKHSPIREVKPKKKSYKPKRDVKIKPSKKNLYPTSNFKPSSKIIVIDAGHGGKDGGAQGGRGLSEKRVVLKVALRLGKELKARGFRVYYTRIKDKFIKLRNRTKMANRKRADLFVSIHANAAPNRTRYKAMHGVETFFLSPARSKRSKNVAALENRSDIAEMDYFSKQTFLNFLNREKIVASNKLALDIQQSMLNSIRKKYRVTDGGVREAPFWVLVGAQMPSVLVEIGYITHPVEGKRIASDSYQKLLVNGIANGVSSYFDKNN